MQKYRLLLTIPLFIPSFVFGQLHEACLRPTEILTAPGSTSPQDFQPGSVVFLSQTYLDKLRRGEYARQPAGLRHYEYIRPGTREEVRSGLNELAAANEVLGPDANVYKQVSTPPGFHFFTPRAGFHGEYEPEWQDPYLILPPGVDPVDVRYEDGRPLQVLEFQPSFLRLRAGEEEWVFFTGFPELSAVFDSEDARKLLAKKQRLANELIGRDLLLDISSGIMEAPSFIEDPTSLSPAIRYMEVTVTSAVARQDQVLLGHGNPTEYVVISPESELKIYDLACERDLLLNTYEERSAANAQLDRRLNEICLTHIPVSTWSRDEALVAGLQARFRLQKDDRLDHRWYDHALLLRDELSQQTYLAARLREDGACFVQSHYASPRGLYHTKIELYAPGGDPVVSSRVSTIDESSVRFRAGGWTVECITFSAPEDQWVLEELVREPQKPLLVRYIAGGSFFQEEELMPEFRGIIRDMYLMSELIQYQSTER